ncbi:MAG TPA: 6-phosphogluconolactonase [Bacteroidota bacterium]|nr:6-phosphogluconolactonase [Bacteroidota bacterium]
MSGTIHVMPSLQAFREAAAKAIVQELRASVEARGTASLVLSGGSTPEAIYRMLAAEPLRFQIDWSHLHLFWSDERCVPPDHAESNFRMVREALLRYVPIPQEHVHRIETEYEPETAARRYAETLRTVFSVKAPQIPQVDLVLLGLGEDGHTASLFPHTPILNEHERLVSAVFVPTLQAYRISLTLPVLNNARCVMFLVAGASKARILSEVIEAPEDKYPAQLVRPIKGRLQWIVDADAGALLTQQKTHLPHSV